MQFEYTKAVEIPERTPGLLRRLPDGISPEWVYSNEGPGTWSPFDIVGHLIVCEQTDFMERTAITLSDSRHRVFAPVDMHAQFATGNRKTIIALLKEFEQARAGNLSRLAALQLTAADLEKSAVHPVIGTTTLGELLATRVAHNLNHIAQVSRVMAKQYLHEVGPFTKYPGILK